MYLSCENKRRSPNKVVICCQWCQHEILEHFSATFSIFLLFGFYSFLSLLWPRLPFACSSFVQNTCTAIGFIQFKFSAVRASKKQNGQKGLLWVPQKVSTWNTRQKKTDSEFYRYKHQGRIKWHFGSTFWQPLNFLKVSRKRHAACFFSQQLVSGKRFRFLLIIKRKQWTV